ncbi:TOBE domain-containing protein [Natronococcus occultus]|uniref:Molybdenum-binding protein n=1 Tax=Natronococcus occultus SP4 TaxID=694430 RepID=L0JY02_9EURY|nr:TOBE domain-containing protein [Natronococcus occultus]AGB37180.1 molybdenum-binding protein [Natronococcus occultus SP4]
MTIEKEYSTQLAADGVTIDRRDIEMLDAIDQYGSLQRAADELGRSYAWLQRRLVELENAVGELTERRRGGSGGGGTELTETAHELRRQFTRHETELDGVAQATESVLAGTVRDRTGELATVETAVGPIVALVPDGATDVQVTVRSDAVVLGNPEESLRADETSLRNQFTGVVEELEAGETITRVTVRLGDDAELQALITNASAERLDVAVGEPIRASFKATAARAIRID